MLSGSQLCWECFLPFKTVLPQCFWVAAPWPTEPLAAVLHYGYALFSAAGFLEDSAALLVGFCSSLGTTAHSLGTIALGDVLGKIKMVLVSTKNPRSLDGKFRSCELPTPNPQKSPSKMLQKLKWGAASGLNLHGFCCQIIWNLKLERRNQFKQ